MLRRVLETGEPEELELPPRVDAEGRRTWRHTTLTAQRDVDGNVAGVLTSTRDITAIKQAEAALAHQAMHDSLTGLANRYLLTDRAAAALARMRRSGGHLTVCFVDLDHFKQINDVHGHESGDLVLREVAALRHSVEADGLDLPVTASVGVAVVDDPEVSVSELLNLADRAMYRAKQNGRDRYETSPASRRRGAPLA